MRERYAVQARLYALAGARLARGGGGGGGATGSLAGVLYLFVRYGLAVAIPTPSERLAVWTRWLAGLTAEVAA